MRRTGGPQGHPGPNVSAHRARSSWPPSSSLPRSLRAHSTDYVSGTIAARCRCGSAAAGEPKSDRLLGSRCIRRAEEAHEVLENLLLLRVVCLRAAIDHFCNDVIPFFGCMV